MHLYRRVSLSICLLEMHFPGICEKACFRLLLISERLGENPGTLLHTHTHTHTHPHTHTQIKKILWLNSTRCNYAAMMGDSKTHSQTFIYTCIHTHIYTHAHTHAHTHTHTYTHTHTHKNTRNLQDSGAAIMRNVETYTYACTYQQTYTRI